MVSGKGSRKGGENVTNTTRSKAHGIVAKVCNEHRNSDLRADNRAICKAFDDALDASELLAANLTDTLHLTTENLVVERTEKERLTAERDAAVADCAAMRKALERAMDAAKSYRSDILKLSGPKTTDRITWELYGHLNHAPAWPARDSSIEVAEAALQAADVGAKLLAEHKAELEKDARTIAAYREVLEDLAKSCHRDGLHWEEGFVSALLRAERLLQSLDPGTEVLKRHAEELADLQETADTWQSTLEDIIELTGAEGASSIASLAYSGVTALQQALATANKRHAEEQQSWQDARDAIGEELRDINASLLKLEPQLAAANKRAEEAEKMLGERSDSAWAALAVRLRDTEVLLENAEVALAKSTAEWEKVNNSCLDERNAAMERARKAEMDTVRLEYAMTNRLIVRHWVLFDWVLFDTRESIDAAMSEAPEGK